MEIAYLAGLFDGEGCILINKLKMRKGETHCQYSLDMRIHQKRKETINMVQQCFGGNVFQNKKGLNSTSPGTLMYTWQCRGVKAGNVLRLILPFLIEKKEQVETGIEFLETFPKYSRKGEITAGFQELYYQKLKLLKTT